jgi:hypothetical protein
MTATATTFRTELALLTAHVELTNFSSVALADLAASLGRIEDAITEALATATLDAEATETATATRDLAVEAAARLRKLLIRNRTSEIRAYNAAKHLAPIANLLVRLLPALDVLPTPAPAKATKEPRVKAEGEAKWHYPQAYKLEAGQVWEGVLRGKPCAEACRHILDVRKGRVYFKDGTGAERNTLVLAFRKWIETGHAMETSAEGDNAQRGAGRGQGCVRQAA